MYGCAVRVDDIRITSGKSNVLVEEFEAVGKKAFVNPDAFIGGFLYNPYGA